MKERTENHEAELQESNCNENQVIEKNELNKKEKFFTLDKIVKIAMFIAVAVLLLLLEFPILISAPYLKLNFSDMPALIITFMYGPIEGIIVEIIKVCLSMLFGISKDIPIGDLGNVILGIAYILPAGLIYRKHKGIKSAIVSLVVSSIVMVITMVFTNVYILMPLYGIPIETRWATALTAILPFNLIKGFGTSFLTFFVYKPLHRLINKINIGVRK